jgi:hypothetical protein
MNRIVGIGLPAAGLLALGAASTSLLGIGVAGASPAAAVAKPPTVTLYANVDAEGDLGSNYGAVSAHRYSDVAIYYVVTFKRAIGACAAVVQAGKAGGTDNTQSAPSLAVADGTNAFQVVLSDNRTNYNISDPFMMTVTCKN